MRPIAFAGAVLTGLGLIVLLHGERFLSSPRRIEARQFARPAGPRPAAPRIGGVVMLAGVVLVTVGSRRLTASS